jgi:uncharacterized protein (TIGR04255 family)
MNKAAPLSYNKPPIVEAIIEIRYEELSDEFINLIVSKNSDLTNKGYELEPVNLSQTTIEVNQGLQQQPITSTKIVGYKAVHKDLPYALQYKTDMFVFSRLQPYEGWDSFYSEARELWDIVYKSLNISPQRVAVRFINIPLNKETNAIELEDYFTVYPELPSEISDLGPFMMQLLLPIKEHANLNCVLSQSVQATSKPHKENVPFILDIDLYQKSNLKSESIWGDINNQRLVKNKIFKESITTKAEKLFQ